MNPAPVSETAWAVEFRAIDNNNVIQMTLYDWALIRRFVIMISTAAISAIFVAWYVLKRRGS